VGNRLGPVKCGGFWAKVNGGVSPQGGGWVVWSVWVIFSSSFFLFSIWVMDVVDFPS